ncbi:uncharacterized protein SOCE26_010060 [Sorangium cellulosum]|uniref:Uncharacterized protein n=1 Tax=Sorangium cellulosum TaxID=56 RepID=A0A2L0EJZ1_SORCE|nr:uncharacterized protein SOCE26_010060 [Sorangium cellulosum]
MLIAGNACDLRRETPYPVCVPWLLRESGWTAMMRDPSVLVTSEIERLYIGVVPEVSSL